jgi:hypothetical protein
VVGMFIGIGMSLLLGLFQRKVGNICIYTNINFYFCIYVWAWEGKGCVHI